MPGVLWGCCLFVAIFGLFSQPARAAESSTGDFASSDPGGAHLVTTREGTLNTRNGLTLHLSTDLGSIHVVPLDPNKRPEVHYSVRIETDARGKTGQELLEGYSVSARVVPSGVEIVGNLPAQGEPGASNPPQFWVRFEISVPASYSLDINTAVGDIETGDIGGTASLITQGGNIFTGNIGTYGARNIALGRPIAHLETQGGHIHVKDVAGDLSAFTAGGHIVTGNVSGNASLRTGGGHITAAGIGGRSELSTEGGNITVGHAGNFVSVKTGGGQIDFGEVRGSVHAQTTGGGIRVMYVAGPMEVESTGGSICLTRVAGSVRAATGDGTITAWINPDNSPQEGGAVRLAGASQLASGSGDIVIFLPRNLAATIEASVENGGEDQIQADPGLAMQFQKSGAGAVRAVATLNGGGAVLRLRTTDGRIRLQYLDSQVKLRESLIRDQLARLRRDFPGITMPPGLAPVAMREMPDVPDTPQLTEQAPEPPPSPPDSVPTAWSGSWIDKLELSILGGVREDADDFHKRIVYAPKPAYPEIARRAGVEGVVRLQVRLTKDGRLQVQKILEGDPSLADAAISAIKNWKGRPVVLDGRPVDVISTVTFDFKLR